MIATPISSDPYTNASSQHRTQLEPDSFGYGNTVVATFQTGRFFDGGSSNIGWATTTNAGRTWTTGMLPGTTVYEGGPWTRISDPAVAYDPLHDVWMISTLAIDSNVSGAAILTSRSTDGGLTWGQPVTTSTSSGSFYDKNWITCDTWPQSPHYGNCYQEWDDPTFYMSTSTDGGLTWGPKRTPGGTGVGGQPVVQPNGTVVVPYEGGAGIRAFRSINGGDTWLTSVAVATVSEHNVAGQLRTSPLPSAEVGGRRQGLRRVAGLRLPLGLHLERHRLQHLDGRRRVDGQGAGSDRPDEQRRRPLHPGLRGRPLDLGRHHAARARLLLLPGRVLHLGYVPAHRRLHLLDRRRRDLDAGVEEWPARSACPGSPARTRA